MSERQNLSVKKKEKIVKRNLTGEVIINEAATEAGVDRDTLQGGACSILNFQSILQLASRVNLKVLHIALRAAPI